MFERCPEAWSAPAPICSSGATGQLGPWLAAPRALHDPQGATSLDALALSYAHGWAAESTAERKPKEAQHHGGWVEGASLGCLLKADLYFSGEMPKTRLKAVENALIESYPSEDPT